VQAEATFAHVGCPPDGRLPTGGPRPSAVVRLMDQTSGGFRCSFCRSPSSLVPVRIAACATMFHQGWITRPDRPDLSAVRSSLLPDEPAREIVVTVQADHAS